MRRAVRLVAVLTLVVLVPFASGCASTVRIGSPQHSCSPGFEPSNEHGRITAQQRGQGSGIQWGVYPNVPAVRFVADVYVNNRRVDHKDQNYPPHGSVPASQIATGDIFRLEGQAYNAKGDVGIFYLTCKAA